MIQRVFFTFCKAKPLLYVFSGQGTQEKGMLNSLLQVSNAKKQIEFYSQKCGVDFIQISTTDKNNVMNITKVTQPLLVLSQVLRFKYLNKNKLGQHDFMIGHSVGEYSALCIAESISLQECLKLVSMRGQLMQTHTKEPSGMLIVRFSDENKQKAMQIIKDAQLSISCYNTPNNINIAGPINKLNQVKEIFKTNRITCLFLPVSAAFHCQMLKSMVEPFKIYLSRLNFHKPRAQILRNLDGQIYKQDSDIKFGLTEHLINPVRFWQSIIKIDSEIQCIQIGHSQTGRKFIEETRKKLKDKNNK